MWKNDVEAYIYWVLVEIIVLYHKKFQNLNINKSYFCIFDGIRRNFNCRSIYKNLLYALNYIIYGFKAWINKIKKWCELIFMGRKKGEAKCKHFIVYYLAIKYTTEAYICVEIAYYVRN